MGVVSKHIGNWSYPPTGGGKFVKFLSNATINVTSKVLEFGAPASTDFSKIQPMFYEHYHAIDLSFILMQVYR